MDCLLPLRLHEGIVIRFMDWYRPNSLLVHLQDPPTRDRFDVLCMIVLRQNSPYLSIIRDRIVEYIDTYESETLIYH